MWDRIVAFFMSIIAFFAGLFGGGGGKDQPAGDNILKNVSYGTEARQIMDIAFPENKTGELGLVLLIHGGMWTAGSKDDATLKGALEYIADAGYVCASMNYRYVSDKISAHDMLDDVSAALECAKKKAAERNISLKKVLLSGQSAGAHLALLYAYSRKDTAPVTPAAVVSYCGPTDFYDTKIIQSVLFTTGLGGLSVELFSNLCGYDITKDNYTTAEAQNALKAISPLYYVNKNTVPTVICHGMVDILVPYVNATVLKAALDINGIKNDLVTYPNSDHFLNNDPDCTAKANQLALEYARAYLK